METKRLKIFLILLAPFLLGGCALPLHKAYYKDLIHEINGEIATRKLSHWQLTPEADERLSTVLTLGEAVELAKLRNPELIADLRAWAAKTEEIPQVTSLPNPELQVRNWQSANPFDFTGAPPLMNMFMIRRQIPWPGKLKNRGLRGWAEAKAARERFREQERAVVQEVKKAYFDFYLSQKRIEILGRNRAVLDRLWNVTRAQYEVGRAEHREVAEIFISLGMIEDEIAEAAASKTMAETKLNALMDRRPDRPLATPQDFTASKLEETLDTLWAKAVERRPELKELRHMIEMEQSSVKLAKLDFFPDFAPGLEWQQQNQAPDFFSALLSLDLPIWWNKLKAGVRQAEHQVEERKAEYEAGETRVFGEIREALAELEASHHHLRTYAERVLPVARQIVAAAEAGYTSDRVSFVELSKMEQDLLEYELAFFKNLVAYEQALADVERGVGADIVAQGGNP